MEREDRRSIGRAEDEEMELPAVLPTTAPDGAAESQTGKRRGSDLTTTVSQPMQPPPALSAGSQPPSDEGMRRRSQVSGEAKEPDIIHARVPSDATQKIEVFYSPTNTRLFRQHSFTAMQRGAAEADPGALTCSRSEIKFSPRGRVQSADPGFGRDREAPPQSPGMSPTLHTGGTDGGGGTSPPDHFHHRMHSQVSGLFVPMVPSQKNYYLSPVHPPFMPTSKNHSFFNNIISPHSSDDGSLSVCSQCLHRSDSDNDNDDGDGDVRADGDSHVSVAPVSHRRTRSRRKEQPVIENLSPAEMEAGGPVVRNDSPAPRAADAAWAGHGLCCVHTDGSCGKHCRLRAARSAEVRRAEREEAFDEEQDLKLHQSNAYSYNLLALGPDPSQPLFHFDQLEERQKYNFFIRGSYRCYYTTKMCLLSAFGWHNETINVWSHFLGFIAFVALTIVLFATTLSSLITAPTMTNSRVVFAVFCFGSMLCMFNSAVYHLFTGHRSLKIFTLMGRMDFLGITTLIVASFIPPLYMQFHCNPNFRIFYMVLICTLGIAGIVGPWTRIFHEVVWLRIAVFVGMAASGVVPAIHCMYVLPLSHMYTSFFNSHISGLLLMFVLYTSGVVFYVTQFPESKFPGCFDTLLSSHQIWHFFVLMAAVVHYCNVVSMYQVWQLSDGAC